MDLIFQLKDIIFIFCGQKLGEYLPVASDMRLVHIRGFRVRISLIFSVVLRWAKLGNCTMQGVKVEKFCSIAADLSARKISTGG